jgi:hypothetical protein
MCNQTIAERMFRYDPAVLFYAPLRTAIWGEPEGPAHFTFDQPSNQSSVGFELDRKWRPCSTICSYPFRVPFSPRGKGSRRVRRPPG